MPFGFANPTNRPSATPWATAHGVVQLIIPEANEQLSRMLIACDYDDTDVLVGPWVALSDDELSWNDGIPRATPQATSVSGRACNAVLGSFESVSGTMSSWVPWPEGRITHFGEAGSKDNRSVYLATTMTLEESAIEATDLKPLLNHSDPKVREFAFAATANSD